MRGCAVTAALGQRLSPHRQEQQRAVRVGHFLTGLGYHLSHSIWAIWRAAALSPRAAKGWAFPQPWPPLPQPCSGSVPAGRTWAGAVSQRGWCHSRPGQGRQMAVQGASLGWGWAGGGAKADVRGQGRGQGRGWPGRRQGGRGCLWCDSQWLLFLCLRGPEAPKRTWPDHGAPLSSAPQPERAVTSYKDTDIKIRNQNNTWPVPFLSSLLPAPAPARQRPCHSGQQAGGGVGDMATAGRASPGCWVDVGPTALAWGWQSPGQGLPMVTKGGRSPCRYILSCSSQPQAQPGTQPDPGAHTALSHFYFLFFFKLTPLLCQRICPFLAMFSQRQPHQPE